jgi:hypothetical protein
MASYTSLAALMARYPEVMILRKYADLNAKNLLYYQAELASLEQELQEIEDEDRKSNALPRHQFDRRWSTLAQAQSTNVESQGGRADVVNCSRDGLQWQVFLKLRRVLFEYSKHEDLGNGSNLPSNTFLMERTRSSTYSTDSDQLAECATQRRHT